MAAPRRPLVVNIPGMWLSKVVDGSTKEITAEEPPLIPDKPQGYIPKPKPDVRAFLQPPISAPATPSELSEVNSAIFRVGGESRRKVTSTPAKATSTQLSTPNVNTAMLVPSTTTQTEQSTMGTPIIIGTTGLRPQAELAAVPALGRVVSQQVIIENIQDEQDGGMNSDQGQLSGSSFETNPFAGRSPYTGAELLLPVTYQPESVRNSGEDRHRSLDYRHWERQQRGQNASEDASHRQLGLGLQHAIEVNDSAQAYRARPYDENTTVGVWENNPNVGYSLPPFSPNHPGGQRLYPVNNQTTSQPGHHRFGTAPIPIYLEAAPISTSLNANGPVFGSANSWAPPNPNLHSNTSGSGNSILSSDGHQSAIVPPLFASERTNPNLGSGHGMMRNSFAPPNGQSSATYAQNMTAENPNGSANSRARPSATTNEMATANTPDENTVSRQQPYNQHSATGSGGSNRNHQSNQQSSNNPVDTSRERRQPTTAPHSTGGNVTESANSWSTPHVQAHGGVYGNSFAPPTSQVQGTTSGFPNGFGLNIGQRGYVPAPPHSYHGYQPSTGPLSPEFEAMEARLHHHIDVNFNRARTIIIDGRDRVIDELVKKFDEVVEKVEKLATSKDVDEVKKQVRSLRDDASSSKKSSADISDAVKHVKDALRNAGIGMEGAVLQAQDGGTSTSGRQVHRGHERGLSAPNTIPGNVNRSQISSTSSASPTRRQSNAAPPTTTQRSLHSSSQHSPRRANSTTGNVDRSRMQVVDMTAPWPAPDIRNHPAYTGARRDRSTSNARLHEIVGEVLSGVHGPIPIDREEGERPVMFEVPNFRNGAWFEQARRHMNR